MVFYHQHKVPLKELDQSSTELAKFLNSIISSVSLTRTTKLKPHSICAGVSAHLTFC